MIRKANAVQLILFSLVAFSAGNVRSETIGSKDAPMGHISPIFGQLVYFTLPAGFKVAFENTRNGAYIREAVPLDETVNQWTEMITVTGAEGLASNPNATPQKVAFSIANGFKKACPTTFSAIPLSDGNVKGAVGEFAMVVSCATSPTTGGKTSESALIVAAKGSADYYTFQWAVRGAPSSSPLNLDKQQWNARIERLLPIKLCARVAGEKEPYPSCLNTKRDD